MKILIGAPIHKIKDYSMRPWLKCVSNLWTPSPTSWKLMMVDNSEDQEWHKQVHEYCKELNFTNYELIHLPDMKDGDDFEAERLAYSREKIQEELLWKGYDYWFSWECDLILPPEILEYLLKFTPEFDAIYHTYPPRGDNPVDVNDYYKEQDGIGCVLYKRNIFHTFKFVDYKTALGGDGRLLFEVIRRGYKIVEIHNIFRLEHLAQ